MKQIPWNRLIIVLVVATAMGCGGATMTQTIAPRPTPHVKFIQADTTVYVSGIKKVAVFPLADYSRQQGNIIADEWGGNIKIQEEITDHLVAHGLSVAVQEDVNTLLIDQDIIRPVDKEQQLAYGTVHETNDDNPLDRVESPEYTLANHTYTEVMAEEIKTIISKKNKGREAKKPKSPILQGCTVGLTKEKVIELAQALDVDLIIRGRIIDYGIKETASLNPLNSGIVTVAFRGTKDLLLGGTGSYDPEKEQPREGIVPSVFGDTRGLITGGTDSRAYDADLDDIDNIAAGAAGGALISGTTGAWIGAGTGYIVGQQPKRNKRTAVVQVRIYAQNGETGDVMWSNRVEMEFTPENNFDNANTHPKVMFDKAVREGVKTLMDGFFAEAEGVFPETAQKPAMVQKEGT